MLLLNKLALAHGVLLKEGEYDVLLMWTGSLFSWLIFEEEIFVALQSKGLRELRIVMAVEAKHIEKFQMQLKELAE